MNTKFDYGFDIPGPPYIYPVTLKLMGNAGLMSWLQENVKNPAYIRVKAELDPEVDMYFSDAQDAVITKLYWS